ncbi:MAG: AAA family ATPase [Lachnospiraceae bacterium]|nr:AAA family ATPase [Lachnospiraceae bacterium]
MLCQFAFKNFKSYKNETTLDFQAATLPEFKDTLITNEIASDLLPVSAIYGPNGGGKSNLLMALSCVISTIVNPVNELEKNHTFPIIQQNVNTTPFAFDTISSDEPTEFRLFFRVGNNEYCYYIAILKDEVVSEDLFRKAVTSKKSATIFERENGKITLGYSINKKSINTDVNPKMPYISFLAINYNIPEIKEAMSWFEGCIIRNYANPTVEYQIMLYNDSIGKNHMLHALNDMDIDITDYRYDSDSHQLYVKRLVDNKEYELPYMEESEGTRKLISALPVILLALRDGRLLIIDELDAKLHPKLLRYVISLFKNKDINRNGAQLLFTSHDMSTLKNTVFRRDEIWFACENDAHESEIYSLHELRNEDGERIKNTASYDKQYLEGRYGADPYLRNMLGGAFE